MGSAYFATPVDLSLPPPFFPPVVEWHGPPDDWALDWPYPNGDSVPPGYSPNITVDIIDAPQGSVEVYNCTTGRSDSVRLRLSFMDNDYPAYFLQSRYVLVSIKSFAGHSLTPGEPRWEWNETEGKWDNVNTPADSDDALLLMSKIHIFGESAGSLKGYCGIDLSFEVEVGVGNIDLEGWGCLIKCELYDVNPYIDDSDMSLFEEDSIARKDVEKILMPSEYKDALEQEFWLDFTFNPSWSVSSNLSSVSLYRSCMDHHCLYPFEFHIYEILERGESIADYVARCGMGGILTIGAYKYGFYYYSSGKYDNACIKLCSAIPYERSKYDEVDPFSSSIVSYDSRYQGWWGLPTPWATPDFYMNLYVNTVLPAYNPSCTTQQVEPLLNYYHNPNVSNECLGYPNTTRIYDIHFGGDVQLDNCEMRYYFAFNNQPVDIDYAGASNEDTMSGLWDITFDYPAQSFYPMTRIGDVDLRGSKIQIRITYPHQPEYSGHWNYLDYKIGRPIGDPQGSCSFNDPANPINWLPQFTVHWLWNGNISCSDLQIPSSQFLRYSNYRFLYYYEVVDFDDEGNPIIYLQSYSPWFYAS